MRRPWLVAGGLALGLVGSQAGHLLVYGVLYGASAGRIESTGAHAYFPSFVKIVFGLVSAFLLIAMLMIGVARLMAGRRLEKAAPGSYLRVAAMLFCLQLACFFAQESIEMAAGAPATSATSLLLWGTVGQLPVALVAALALRWLAIRLGPAVARLIAPATPALRLAPRTVALVVWPAPLPAVVTNDWLNRAFTRRGPPL